MYNILFAYTKKKRLLLTTLCGLFLRTKLPKGTFHLRKEKNKKKENFDPVLIGV